MKSLIPDIAKAQTTMFRIAADRVASSATADDAESFREEIDYLHYFVIRLGEDLGMQMVDYGAFVEGESKVGFRFNQSHGVQTSEINGMVSTANLPIKQLLDELI
jgi:hypothetical protein